MSEKVDKFIIYILLFLVIFTPLAFGTVQEWSILLLESVVILTTGIWLCKIYFEEGITFQKTIIYIPLVLFGCLLVFQMLPLPGNLLKIVSPQAFDLHKIVVKMLGSINYTNEKHISTLSLYKYATAIELVKVITYFLVFLLVMNTIKQRKQIELVIGVILSVGFLVSVFGIIQSYSGTNKLYWVQSLASGGAPFGPFVNRDHFGGYINMIIPLGFGLLISNIDRSRKLLLGFMAMIMISALFISAPRGAILSFLASVVVLTILMLVSGSVKKSVPLIILILGFGFLFILWLGWTPLIERFSQFTRSEIYVLYPRVPAWQASLNIIKNFFVFGTGGGTFEYVFPICRPEKIGEIFEHLHNDYLQVLFENGLIGFLIMAVFILFFLWNIVARFKKVNNVDNTGLFIGGVVSCASMFLHSFIDFNLRLPGNAFLFFLIMGLTYNISGLTRDDEPVDFSRTWSNVKITKKWYKVISGLLILAVVLWMVIPIIKKYVSHRYFISAQDKNEYTGLYRAVKWQPDNPEYHYKLGFYYEKEAAKELWSDQMRLLSLSQAKQEMIKAISLGPVKSKYWAGLGWILGNLDKNKEAEECFMISIKLEPNGKYSHLLYGLWNLRMANKFQGQDKQQFLMKGKQELETANYLLKAGLDKPNVIAENQNWFDKAIKDAGVEDLWKK